MKNLQKIGGVSSLIEAATYIVGFVLYFGLLASANYGSLEIDPIQNVAFLAEHQNIMYAWHFVIYVLFGVCLVILVAALDERLKAHSSAVVKLGSIFGFIWAGLVIASGMLANVGASVIIDVYAKDPERAATLWVAMNFVVDGLGGGNEIVGGLWILLISWAALQSGKLPKALNYLGVVISISALLTVIPALGELGVIFGLGSIVWFIWLGIVLLRNPTPKKSAIL